MKSLKNGFRCLKVLKKKIFINNKMSWETHWSQSLTDNYSIKTEINTNDISYIINGDENNSKVYIYDGIELENYLENHSYQTNSVIYQETSQNNIWDKKN